MRDEREATRFGEASYSKLATATPTPIPKVLSHEMLFDTRITLDPRPDSSLAATKASSLTIHAHLTRGCLLLRGLPCRLNAVRPCSATLEDHPRCLLGQTMHSSRQVPNAEVTGGNTSCDTRCRCTSKAENTLAAKRPAKWVQAVGRCRTAQTAIVPLYSGKKVGYPGNRRMAGKRMHDGTTGTFPAPRGSRSSRVPDALHV